MHGRPVAPRYEVGVSAPATPSIASSVFPPRRRRPALVLFAGLFLLLLLTHLPLLNLPYYWDEAGYFVPAALDLLRHGWWVPRSTLPNGHPPLLMAWLAATWSIFGFTPVVTRTAMLACAAVTLLGLYRLGEEIAGERTARWAVLLYAVTPLFFAQASLAQLDLPATMFVLWALVFRVRRQPVRYALAAAAACLSKDTALVAFFALAWVDLVSLVRDGSGMRGWVRQLAPHLLPAVVLAGWYACNHAVTGYWVGNPQYLAYNVGDAAFSLPRILLSLLRRLWQLLGYNGTWLLTLLGVLAARRWGSELRRPRRFADLMAVIIAYVVFHSILGGAVLARYLLPALALYLLLLTPALLRLGEAMGMAAPAGHRALLLACAAFLTVNWFWNPPYPFPYEDNLAYVTFIRLHQQADAWLLQHPPQGPVLTAWPAAGELQDPDLGYVAHRLPVQPVDDFTPASLRAVEAVPPRVGAALIYSREYRPQFDLAEKVPFWQHWSDRVFHHQPPQPDAVLLQRLCLHRVYLRHMAGQWVEIAEP